MAGMELSYKDNLVDMTPEAEEFGKRGAVLKSTF